MLFKIDQDGSGSEQKLMRMTVTYFPSMGLFSQTVDLESGTFTVAYTPPPDTSENKAGPSTLQLLLEPEIDTLEEVDVSLHGSDARAMNMGKEINDWFSTCFGWDVMLAYIPPGRTRKVLGNLSPKNAHEYPPKQREGSAGQNSWFSTFTNYVPTILQSTGPQMEDEGLTFADCAPYLIVSEESVSDVSSRLPDGAMADVTKFRPNIVLEGAKAAYEEDYWGAISISSKFGCTLNMILTQNCIRCQSLDIDYTRGIFAKEEKGTMLKKLMRDRRVDMGKKYSPVFGRYGFLGDKEGAPETRGGAVAVGSEVHVSKWNEERTKFCTHNSRGGVRNLLLY
ncbi:MAG: hypothetical protein Q9223_004514 [Gallowayella weberi]